MKIVVNIVCLSLTLFSLIFSLSFRKLKPRSSISTVSPQTNLNKMLWHKASTPLSVRPGFTEELRYLTWWDVCGYVSLIVSTWNSPWGQHTYTFMCLTSLAFAYLFYLIFCSAWIDLLTNTLKKKRMLKNDFKTYSFSLWHNQSISLYVPYATCLIIHWK